VKIGDPSNSRIIADRTEFDQNDPGRELAAAERPAPALSRLLQDDTLRQPINARTLKEKQ
jgi:hypothetical protein